SSQGLKVVDESVAKCRIKVQGAISAIQSALSVQLNEYEHPTTGRFRGREGDVQVPSDLAGVITGVYGLDTRRVGESRRRRIEGRSAPWDSLKATTKSEKPTLASLTNKWPGTFFPPQVAQLYQYPSQLDGTGQNIAIFAFNGPQTPDGR